MLKDWNVNMHLKTLTFRRAGQGHRAGVVTSLGLLFALIANAGSLAANAGDGSPETLPAATQSSLPDRVPSPIKDSIAPAPGSASGAVEKAAETSTTGGGAPAGEQKVAPPAAESSGAASGAPRVIYKPGQELSFGTDTEDLVPTDDVVLARKQVAAYPSSPEASFILAVALTRTSHVEEALNEVRRAKKLAEAKGGPAYFDEMIGTYEEMLKNLPKENRVRYGLAWAYYMKAYLTAQHSRKIQKWKEAQALAQGQGAGAAQPGQAKPSSIWDLAAAASAGDPAKQPRIESALEKAEPTFRPQIKKYYEAALTKLDELLAQKPDDIWAQVYRAFLKAEYTGNLEQAMDTWKRCRDEAPENPAPYFFLGEGYLRQGNLKECFSNVSRAIALRALGK